MRMIPTTLAILVATAPLGVAKEAPGTSPGRKCRRRGQQMKSVACPRITPYATGSGEMAAPRGSVITSAISQSAWSSRIVPSRKRHVLPAIVTVAPSTLHHKSPPRIERCRL